MKRLCRLACYLSLAATLAAGASAFADTFTFQVTGESIGDYNLTGSGTLTAIPDPSLSGVFEITGISGNIDGVAISGLLPCATYSISDPCIVDSIGFDNLLYPAGDPAFYNTPPYVLMELDGAGLGIELTNGLALDIGAANGHQYQLSDSTQIGAASPNYVSFTATQTPEPSTFILFAAGLLGIAASMRHRISI